MVPVQVILKFDDSTIPILLVQSYQLDSFSRVLHH